MSLFKAFGASGAAFHVANLVLYAVVVLEVFALAATFVDGSRAWLAAALFAAYPRHGESVAWISGSTDLVATAIALAAVLLARSRVSFALRTGGALALTAVATLTKELAFTLPVLTLLVLRRERGRRELVIPGAMVLVEALVFVVRYQVIGGLGGYSGYPWTLPRMIASAAAYGLASGMPPSVPAFRYWVVFLVPVALLALGIWRVVVLRRRGRRDDARTAWTGAAWFAVAVLPLLSLPLDLNNAAGERDLLLPSVGLALAVGALVPRPRRPLGTASAGAALALLAALSLYSSFDWVDAGRLSDRLLSQARALGSPGGEVVFLSAPENYRTAHVFLGGDLDRELGYRRAPGFTTAVCSQVELRAVRGGMIRFRRVAAGFAGLSGWSAPFDFPVLRSSAGLTGECGQSRLPGGPEPPGMGLRALVTPTPSRSPVVLAYFDGRDFERCC